MTGAGQNDNHTRVFDINTGSKLAEYRCRGSVRSVCLEAELPVCWSGALDTRVYMFDTRISDSEDAFSFRAHTSGVHRVQIDRRLNLLVTSCGRSESTVKVWDLRRLPPSLHPSDTSLAPPLHTLEQHTSAVSCFQFDGFKLISGSYDGSVLIHNMSALGSSEPHVLRSPGKSHGEPVQALSYSGNKLVVGTNGSDDNLFSYNF